MYDARLVQEEPAYAVTKGALSVSVAPFQAIAANNSQMTFQVLVPSLNVFVDRKIQLQTGLSFSAQLYYSGSRSLSQKTYLPIALNAVIQGNVMLVTLASTGAVYDGIDIGSEIYGKFVNGASANASISGIPITAASVFALGTPAQPTVTTTSTYVPAVPPADPTVTSASTVTPAGLPTVTTTGTTAIALPSENASGVTVAPGTIVVAWAGQGTGQYILNFPQNYFSVEIATSTNGTVTSSVVSLPIGVIEPGRFDVPDPACSIHQDSASDPGGFMNLASQDYTAAGYCTAVGPKDLSWCAFPIQSCLANMTATMNDCTVTTNGDTLKEQLLLTSLRHNNIQRTTPTKLDTYAWGRDDAQNSSGNFSSYSTVQDGNGELPNGSYPTTWFSDPQCSKPLSTATDVAPGNIGGGSSYPFGTAGAAYSFNVIGNNSIGGGIGWYIGTSSGASVSGAGSGDVVVPFVNNQPVWTCGFPGGDLLEVGATYASNSDNSFPSGFAYNFVGGVGIKITLLVDVPPLCMVGARLYSADATTGRPTLAFVSSLQSGALGQVGSVYLCCSQNGNDIAGLAPTGLCLGAGFQATVGPMPVYGQVSVVEPLVISPLIWADSAEFQTVGLYGMTNMQFVLNFASPSTTVAQSNSGVDAGVQSTRTLPYWTDNVLQPNTFLGNPLRSSGLRTTLSNFAFGQSNGLYGPWNTPRLYVNFLTPGPDVTLPLVSSIPYVEFPRYVTVKAQMRAGPGSKQLDTNTISLTSIPDMVMLYAKPGYRGPSQLDQYIPMESVTVTFDNFSNLCSSFQQFNLYESAVAAGLEMDWNQWRGYTQAAYPSLALAPTVPSNPLKYRQTGYTQLSGGPIILRMGIDITLSPGLAPGCLGNYSFQANMRTHNPHGYYDYLDNATIYLVAINTGFFETVRGQSAIRKTILNSADVEASSPDTGMTKTDLHRMVGRGGNNFVGGATVMTKALRSARLYNRHGMKSMLGGPGGKRPRMEGMGGGGSGIL